MFEITKCVVHDCASTISLKNILSFIPAVISALVAIIAVILSYKVSNKAHNAKKAANESALAEAEKARHAIEKINNESRIREQTFLDLEQKKMMSEFYNYLTIQEMQIRRLAEKDANDIIHLQQERGDDSIISQSINFYHLTIFGKARHPFPIVEMAVNLLCFENEKFRWLSNTTDLEKYIAESVPRRVESQSEPFAPHTEYDHVFRLPIKVSSNPSSDFFETLVVELCEIQVIAKYTNELGIYSTFEQLLRIKLMKWDDDCLIFKPNDADGETVDVRRIIKVGIFN